MKNSKVTSCKQCKHNCCEIGPGKVHRIVPPEEYVANFGFARAYGTRCAALHNGKCKLWGTRKIPMSCKLYVCHLREYSKEEIKHIKKKELGYEAVVS